MKPPPRNVFILFFPPNLRMTETSDSGMNPSPSGLSFQSFFQPLSKTLKNAFKKCMMRQSIYIYMYIVLYCIVYMNALFNIDTIFIYIIYMLSILISKKQVYIYTHYIYIYIIIIYAFRTFSGVTSQKNLWKPPISHWFPWFRGQVASPSAPEHKWRHLGLSNVADRGWGSTWEILGFQIGSSF